MREACAYRRGMAETLIVTPDDMMIPVTLHCRDGVRLAGHEWPAQTGASAGCVIINPATGVQARYYHRYARFLAQNGFDVLTYDYRGIGLSRPKDLRGCGYRWREWGEQDFDAALRHVVSARAGGPILVVGHSIGGFLPGLSQDAAAIDRMLTMGAQYAWWGDYVARRRLALFWKWHMVMPAATALFGYFPGKRFGWLEDLPAGIANEWSFRGPRFERSHPASERQAALSRMAAVKAPILAVAMADDELGTLPAIRRTLAYYTSADRRIAHLSPADYGRQAIGHFNLFHDSHRDGFWTETLHWLQDGRNPWPEKTVGI